MRISHWLLVAALACGALLTACSPSKADIEAKSKALTQQIIDQNAGLNGLGLVVDRVDAIQEAGNKYKGIAQVVMDGQHYSVPLSILSDGDKIMVTPEDGAFGFAVAKAVTKALADAAPPPIPVRKNLPVIKVLSASVAVRENEFYRVLLTDDHVDIDFCATGWDVAILKDFDWSNEKGRRVDNALACWNMESGITTVKYFDVNAPAQSAVKQFTFDSSTEEFMMYDTSTGALSKLRN